MIVIRRRKRRFDTEEWNWIPALYRKTKNGARHRGIPFDLTLEEFERIAARANGECELTALPWCFDDRPGSFKRPFIPSIDRIDSKKGYTFSNVRLVCAAVNLARHQWDDGVFELIIRSTALKMGISTAGFSAGDFLTVNELAQRWGVAVSTVHGRVRSAGLFRHVNRFGNLCFLRSDIEDLEEEKARGCPRFTASPPPGTPTPPLP